MLRCDLHFQIRLLVVETQTCSLIDIRSVRLFLIDDCTLNVLAASQNVGLQREYMRFGGVAELRLYLCVTR